MWGLLARFLGGEEEQPRRPSSREELVKTPIVLKGLQFMLCSVILRRGRVYWHLIQDNGIKRPTSFGSDPNNLPKPLYVDDGLVWRTGSWKSVGMFVGSECGGYHQCVVKEPGPF
ncbi:hypothetical protein QC764_204955 [Podospora pseudoanserina]|uniref:Uncharacterized protein n=1 Tax=Podospora pseudoanserina TaxID=2609844 RepID=A0ABR0IGJ8_9PEZI|nr:hypothetical protein QC764_204955 [Podospora pseudoanserina]